MARFVWGCLLAAADVALAMPLHAAESRPNIVFILADDLGYGDLGCYGQEKIRTPNLDRLAKNGMLFTHCYAGSTVCAPSRCALMTGLHTGHCRVRGNGGGGSPRSNVPLKPEDVCVAEILKKQGYATALVGKWGLGEEGSTGVPTKKGFDFFFGYLNQLHAHNYYPPYLIRNEKREPIPENVQKKGVEGVAEKPVVYAPDRLLDEAIKFIDANKAGPFFLYIATIVPHANNEKTAFDKNGNEEPSDSPYSAETWPQPEKNKAAMITRLDTDVGKLLKKLDDLDLAKNTIVIFSSDNGPHKEGGNDPAFFKSSGPFSGFKRSLTDGGIRMPMIVRWPGVVKPNTTNHLIWAFWDFLPTVAEIVGAMPPENLDGISVLPTMTGKGKQQQHNHLYWEFHEGGFKQAVRWDNWKAIRLGPDQPVRLYDMILDVAESTDVAGKNADVVAKMTELMKTSRTDSTEFPIRVAKKK
jgi:arylsulfatase A-like enzyme